MSTRETLFYLNVLAQRCIDMNQDIYLSFLDIEKAFDKIQHGKPVEILIQKNVDGRDVNIIAYSCRNHSAHVKVD